MTYETKRYFLMTVDPVHIGIGGTRLGRVDNSIVREPGTRLPKIPGTSLSGAIRAYAATRYGKRRCAGQGQPGEGKKGHCGRPTCPICYTFGFVKGEHTEKAHSGVVSIGDARLLLFPVYSMVGPVWVTSSSTLADFGIRGHDVDDDKARWSNITNQGHLNLGWLMVEKQDDLPLTGLPGNMPDTVKERIVLISDKIFSQVVNSNLEVRTSVTINPETGAAEDKALFTYEAIPRAACLWLDMVVDDYRDKFPDRNLWFEKCRQYGLCNDALVSTQAVPDTMPEAETDVERLLQDLGYIGNRPARKEDEADTQFQKRQQEYWKQVQRAWEGFKHALENLQWAGARDIVGLGMDWLTDLGVGGMGTRGFGRIRSWEVTL